MDKGPEFTSHVLDVWALRHEVKLRYIEPAKPMQNPYLERFNGKFRGERLNQHWLLYAIEANRITERWRQEYNHVRPHSSLANSRQQRSHGVYPTFIRSQVTPSGENASLQKFPKQDSRLITAPRKGARQILLGSCRSSKERLLIYILITRSERLLGSIGSHYSQLSA